MDGIGNLFGLLGSKDKTPAMTKPDIVNQLALVVEDKLTATGASADPVKIKESLGFNLDQYSAWSQVMTDANVVNSIADKVIRDLIASNLVSGAEVKTTVNVPNIQLPSIPTNIHPMFILAGGVVLIMLMRRR